MLAGQSWSYRYTDSCDGLPVVSRAGDYSHSTMMHKISTYLCDLVIADADVELKWPVNDYIVT